MKHKKINAKKQNNQFLTSFEDHVKLIMINLILFKIFYCLANSDYD